MWRKRIPRALLVGMQTGAATMEKSADFPQKIKNETSLSPSNSTSGYLSKENQNTNSKGCMYPCIHCNIIDNSQDTEATKVPISGRRNMYIHKRP